MHYAKQTELSLAHSRSHSPARPTHLELLVLRGLDGSLGREVLDELDGLLELGGGHCR